MVAQRMWKSGTRLWRYINRAVKASNTMNACGTSANVRSWLHKHPTLLAQFRRADEGAVTAEYAVILPAVVVMAVLLLMLTRASTVSLNCQDAAAAAVRTAIIAQDDGKARDAAKRAAGTEADVSLQRSAGQVTAIVSCPVVPDPMHVLPTVVQGKASGAEQ